MGEAVKCTVHVKVGERHSNRCAFSNNVSVGGMPRHVLDLRRVVDSSTDEEPEEVSEDIVLRRSQRERRRPMWMKDYVEGESSKEDEELHTNSL